MVRGAEEALLAANIVKNGDVMGVISGTIGASGSTNIMRLHTVGTDNISGDLQRARRQSAKSAAARSKK